MYYFRIFNSEIISTKGLYVTMFGKLSFVIPCYGSEKTIQAVVGEIRDWICANSSWGYEIIAVNDNSPDGVGSVLRGMAASDHRLKVIELAMNRGKHAAMMAGYRYATGDLIVNLDDDGQCPLDQLSLLLDAVSSGADIALAYYPQKKQSAFKNFGSKINEWMAQSLIGQPKKLQISNFSVIRRFVLEEIVRYKNPYPYMNGLFLRSTAHIVNVEMEERERAAGVSGYTFKKSLSLWLNGFTAFSVKPLRIATVIGALCAFLGFLFGFWVVVRKVCNPDILAGYSSMMALLLFIGGIIMLMLGLIGEYIGRIYICINQSPQYVIRQIINIEDGPERGTGGDDEG
jgi:undecaprenyl-phosphate 4-deoxy-4-formamido-L-arabinose transferase